MEISVRAGGVSIGGNVAVVELQIPEAEEQSKHTMLVLDCSASMVGSIAYVRRDSQAYVDKVGADDFVSVIVFSGHGFAKLIAGPVQCTQSGKTLLKRAIQREVQTLNTTVFSEPLALSIETAKRLSGTDITHSAVLFTDGCAVPTRWGVETEHNKAFAAARVLREMGAVVSVIGYGVYYDEEFIVQLMQAAGNSGMFLHISDIENFAPVVERIQEIAAKTVIAEINLTFSPGTGKAGRVFKLTPQIIASEADGGISAMGLYEGRAQLFVELSSPSASITVSGRVGSEDVQRTLRVESLTDESAREYVFVLGAHAFLSGDHDTAAQMFSSLHEEGLAEQAACAYTTREARETADIFRRYFVDRKFIGAGLKPTGPSHCVLNVLRVLIEDEGNIVSIPAGAYERSGLLKRDPRVVESPLGRTLRIVGYRSDQSRFNFSVLCLKDVKVRPEDGGAPVDRKIWRTYNIILDGNLHTPELSATLTRPSFQLLQEAGVIDAAETYDPSRSYTINLRSVKLISPNWANPATLGLVPLMREEAELEAEQTALNRRRKELGVPDAEDTEIYRESAVEVEDVPVEHYTASCCEYRLMKYKAGPYDCSGMTYDEATARVKEVRQRLIVVRYLTRAITFAMELVGSKSIGWDAGKEVKRGESSKREQLATYQGMSLKRVTWVEEFVCS